MLELSTKYAIKALLHLKNASNGHYMQVKTLSDETGIPGPYLSKVIKQLAASKLVDTRRGISGGVRPLQNNRLITFFDVCMAMEDPIVFQRCFFSRTPCDSKNHCVMHTSWSKLKGDIERFLKRSKIG